MVGINTQAIARHDTRLGTVRNSTSRPTGTISARPLLKKARHDQKSKTAGVAAEHRAHGEERERGAEDTARVESIRDLPGGGNESRRLTKSRRSTPCSWWSGCDTERSRPWSATPS